MGREVRRVPPHWEHPKDETGAYIPLFDGSFKEAATEWDENAVQWENGYYRFSPQEEWRPKESDKIGTFEEWDGPRPKEQEYMPDWTESERTHYQMYESCNEGTPISPVMETPEVLARWLADNKASAFGSRTATYSQWLASIKKGFAHSVTIESGTLISGVEDNQ